MSLVASSFQPVLGRVSGFLPMLGTFSALVFIGGIIMGVF